MKIMNQEEIDLISGGFTFLPFIAGTVINLVAYAIQKKVKHEEMTPQGIAISAATGALTGGVGTAAVKAAGAGLAGNIAWRPGFIAINQAGQLIAQDK